MEQKSKRLNPNKKRKSCQGLRVVVPKKTKGSNNCKIRKHLDPL
jgi:hypothetical protein